MPRTPRFQLLYAGVDISEEVTPLTLTISYIDKLEGESDELSVDLINSDLRWLNSWLPNEGDSVELRLGYEGEAFLGPVAFQIDEMSWQGAPDRFTLKALGTPITKALRQRNTQAYEGVALLEIAQQIAEKHSLELVGAESIPAINFKRVTQKEQADLDFLRELAMEYGVIFKVQDTTRLVFYREEDLEAASSILTLDRTDLESYRLKLTAAGKYKAATVNYQDGETGEFIEVTVDVTGEEVEVAADTEDPGLTAIANDDILKIRERSEDRGQAEIKAQEALKRANSDKIEATLSIEGNQNLSAGVNIDLTGFGLMNGKFLINEINHIYDRRRGYRSAVKARRILN